MEPPRAGLGKSDGKGTFRRYVDMATLGGLRFDPQKDRAHRGRYGRGGGKASGKGKSQVSVVVVKHLGPQV